MERDLPFDSAVLEGRERPALDKPAIRLLTGAVDLILEAVLRVLPEMPAPQYNVLIREYGLGLALREPESGSTFGPADGGDDEVRGR